MSGRRSIAGNWKKRLIRKAKRHGSYIEAIAAGRTIMGTRIKAWDDVSDEFQDRRSHAIYEYEVDGKKYRKGLSSKYSDPPPKLDFYYTKSPKKVFSDYDGNDDVVTGLLLPVLFFMALVVVYVYAKLLGVDLEIRTVSALAPPYGDYLRIYNRRYGKMAVCT